MDLQDLLNLLPDNSTGEIDAADLRTIVTELWNLHTTSSYFYESYSWQYSNAALPPTGNQVRADNTNLALATLLEFRQLDNDGNDRTNILRHLKAEDRVRISDWNNSVLTYTFRVTGPAVVTADTVQVPVQFTAGSGTIPNAKAEVELALAVTI